MQASLALDQWANPANATSEMRACIRYKPENKRGKGLQPSPYFPKGTVFSGEQALMMCRIGQAIPIDAECKEALGWTDAQIAAANVEYEMDCKGIVGDDRELYRSGVILGYTKDLKYIPGPQWAAYQECLKEVEQLEDGIDDESGDSEVADAAEVSDED